MGWERRGAHNYYYRKERDGSRVRSVYVGRGEWAHLNAALFAAQREDRKINQDNKQRELDTLNAVNADIDALARMQRLLTESVLISVGFHQHNRQWRKRRP